MSVSGSESGRHSYVLVMGRLSLAGVAELAKRVRAGEDETAVRVELLEREGKALVAPAGPARAPGSARGKSCPGADDEPRIAPGEEASP